MNKVTKRSGILSYPDPIDSIESNWENLNIFDKIKVNIQLLLGNLVRADIKRCPKCGKLTQAYQGGVTAFGWKFRTKCHRCGNIFEWNESVI